VPSARTWGSGSLEGDVPEPGRLVPCEAVTVNGVGSQGNGTY